MGKLDKSAHKKTRRITLRLFPSRHLRKVTYAAGGRLSNLFLAPILSSEWYGPRTVLRNTGTIPRPSSRTTLPSAARLLGV